MMATRIPGQDRTVLSLFLVMIAMVALPLWKDVSRSVDVRDAGHPAFRQIDQEVPILQQDSTSPTSSGLRIDSLQFPDTASFGTVRFGTCDTLRIPLTNMTSAAVTLDSILFNASSPSLSYIQNPSDTTLLLPGATREFTFIYCPDDTLCVWGVFELSLRRLDNDSSDLRTVFIGGCSGRPIMLLSPSIVRSAATSRGSCRIDTFSLRNVGNYPLTVDLVDLAIGQQWEVLTQTPIRLLPGTSKEILVRFCPTVEGAFNDTLIVHGDGVPSELTALLLGEGMLPSFEYPPLVDFGEVTVGSCVDTLITIRNVSRFSTQIADITFESTGTPFTLVGSYDSLYRQTLQFDDSVQLHLRFCPDDSGFVASPFPVTVLGANGEEVSISMQGRGLLPQLDIDVDQIDFGPQLAGTCHDTVVMIRNNGKDPIVISQLFLDGIGQTISGPFELIGPTLVPTTLKPSDSLPIILRFCPPQRESYTSELGLLYEPRGEKRINLTGRGLIPMIWLDSTVANAGSEGTISLHIWPIDAIDRKDIRVVLGVNPDALFARRIASTGTLSMNRGKDGAIEITGTPPQILSPDGVVTSMTFLGLSSGEPSNRVEIREFDLASSVLRWDTIPGMIYLNGCDVGKMPGAGKRINFRGVSPNPATSNVRILYQSPSGQIPLLHIYDARGSLLRTVELPEGDGNLHEFVLPLDDLSPGFYMLELVDRAEHSFFPLHVD